MMLAIIFPNDLLWLCAGSSFPVSFRQFGGFDNTIVSQKIVAVSKNARTAELASSSLPVERRCAYLLVPIAEMSGVSIFEVRPRSKSGKIPGAASRKKLAQDLKQAFNDETRGKWLKYQNAFPHQSAYFRATPQYANQISVVNGKKQGTDINLYKLFVEQCYNLLRDGGLCGLVVPSGIYTDLGAKQLREMLFDFTRITGLFCFENRKNIFEGVDSRFKFVVLTYRKGEHTDTFDAAFMRHEVSELVHFPQQGAQKMSVDLIRQLSPDSLSIMEFKNEIDVRIAQKMLKHPLLGKELPGTWNLVLGSEFYMTNDHYLFETEPGPGYLPLYEGKMIHQFTHTLRSPRYWVDEQKGRASFLGRKADKGQRLNYQSYRLGYRSVGRTTDQRALIASILPSNSFAGNSLILTRRVDVETGEEIIDDDHIYVGVAARRVRSPSASRRVS